MRRNVSLSYRSIHCIIFAIVRPPPRFPGHHPHFSQHQHHHHPNSTGQTSSALNSSIVPVQPGNSSDTFESHFHCSLFSLQKGEIGFDGKMLRKAMARKTVDYNPSIIRYLEVNYFPSCSPFH